jgi:hypothetical protein
MKKDTGQFRDKAFAGQQKEFRKLASKIDGVQGSLEARFIRCGRANCKCTRGELHGPYFYHRYRSGGRRRRRYVKAGEVEALRAGIAEYREQRAQIIEANKYLRGGFQELKARARDLVRRMRAAGLDV